MQAGDINSYRMYRDILKDRIEEPGKKIEPKKWERELETLRGALDDSQKEYSDTECEFAIIETLEHNKKDLDRMIENESHRRAAERNKDRKKGIE